MKLCRLPRMVPALLLGLGLVFTAPAPDGHAQSSHSTAGGVEQAAQSSGEALEQFNVHDHPERGLMDQAVSEMIWAVVVFSLFFAVLAVVVWPKILGGLQAREDKQRNDLLAAEKASRDATTTLAEYQAQLAEARKESQNIVAEARAAAQLAANADKARIEAEIAAMKASAKSEIAAAKESALNDIYAQAASLSTSIAGKILQRELNPQDQQALVNQSLDQLRASVASN